MKNVRGFFYGLAIAIAMSATAATVYNYFPPPGMTYAPTTGLVIGTATGGAQGTGTVNAQGVFINGTAALTSSGVPTGANPTGAVGLAAVNGVATTFLRSDAAPALSQSITPTWTGLHTFSSNVVFNNSGGATDTKNTLFRESTVSFSIQSATDAAPSTLVTALLNGARTGTAWTAINFGNTTDNPTFSFLGTGQLSISGGVVVGGATGGNQGTGTINMTGCFVNGVACSTGGAAAANPTGTVGLTTVNGAAATYMRSDAAPPLSQSISPTWTGTHTFSSLVGNGATVFQGANTGSGYNIKFRDTTNATDRGFIGLGTTTVTGAAVTDFAIVPGVGGSIVIGTANGAAIGTRFGSAGNVTTNAPTSGASATFNGIASSAQSIVNLIGGTNGSAALLLQDGQTGTRQWLVEAGNPAVGNFRIRDATAGADRLVINTTGDINIPAPSSGTAFSVQGGNGNTSVFSAQSTSGSAFGVVIQAGTTSADYALNITSQNTATQFLKVFGDGGVTAGSPTGGDKGVGTINVTGCFVNGVPCLTGSSGGFTKFAAGLMTTSGGNTCTINTNGGGLSTCTEAAAGRPVVNFVTSYFPTAFYCNASAVSANLSQVINTNGINLNSIQVYISQSGSNVDGSFNITCFGN